MSNIKAAERRRTTTMKKKKKEKRRLIFICLIGRFSFMKNSHSRPFSQSPFKCGLIAFIIRDSFIKYHMVRTWYRTNGSIIVILLKKTSTIFISSFTTRFPSSTLLTLRTAREPTFDWSAFRVSALGRLFVRPNFRDVIFKLVAKWFQIVNRELV